MSVTDNFKRQHNEIVEIVGKISVELKADQLAENADLMRELLMALAGKLKMHLTMEDEALYPNLINHTDANIRNTAKKFVEEMGGIKEVFARYVEKWPVSGAIENDAEEFIKETESLFAALGNRVDRENNELYPLLDKV